MGAVSDPRKILRPAQRHPPVVHAHVSAHRGMVAGAMELRHPRFPAADRRGRGDAVLFTAVAMDQPGTSAPPRDWSRAAADGTTPGRAPLPIAARVHRL